jgi:hypothetical protein
MDWLFDSSVFVPREVCGDWSGGLATASKLADFFIFLPYAVIPFILIYFWYHRRDHVPKPIVLILFAMFIIFCGWTHLNDILVFTWPAYRFFVLIKVITAFCSMYTMIILGPVCKYFLSLPSFEEQRTFAEQMRLKNEQLQLEMTRRELSEAECKDQNKKLLDQLNLYEDQLKQTVWVEDRQKTLHKLREMLVSGINE